MFCLMIIYFYSKSYFLQEVHVINFLNQQILSTVRYNFGGVQNIVPIEHSLSSLSWKFNKPIIFIFLNIGKSNEWLSLSRKKKIQAVFLEKLRKYFLELNPSNFSKEENHTTPKTQSDRVYFSEVTGPQYFGFRENCI